MKKPSKFKISWQKVALVSSLILNIVFITGFMVVQALAPRTVLAQLDYANAYFCKDMYDNIVRQLNSDESRAAYAMTTCLKNYKNGKDLDISSLIKQVNETPPLTNYPTER